MSIDWLLNVEVPFTELKRLCRAVTGAQVSIEDDDVFLTFPTGSAWAYDAAPDDGTDIIVRDHSESVQWRLWEHFATEADAPMHMWQLFGLLVVERVARIDAEGSHLETWNTRELGARLARRALTGPLDAAEVHDLVARTYLGPSAEIGDRAVELAAELVRHEVLLPGRIADGTFRAWEETASNLSQRIYTSWPDPRSAARPALGQISFGPGRKTLAAASEDDIDTKTLTDWMREPDAEMLEDGSWVFTDQT